MGGHLKLRIPTQVLDKKRRGLRRLKQSRNEKHVVRKVRLYACGNLRRSKRHPPSRLGRPRAIPIHLNQTVDALRCFGEANSHTQETNRRRAAVIATPPPEARPNNARGTPTAWEREACFVKETNQERPQTAKGEKEPPEE